MTTHWHNIGNTSIKLQTGVKSQTVNICHPNSRSTDYEHKFRIVDPAEFLSVADLTTCDSVGNLIRDVTTRGFREEPGGSHGTLMSVLPPHESWGTPLVPLIDDAIAGLVESFLGHPYRHRVEHSLHCDLFARLTDAVQQGQSQSLVELDEFAYGCVQKEWPETIARADKNGRRGNFDLSILTPPAPEQTITLDHFLGGCIRPFAAFELGLDYGEDHFSNDCDKLENSKISNAYVLHFARRDNAAQEQAIESAKERIRSGTNLKILACILGRDELVTNIDAIPHRLSQ